LRNSIKMYLLILRLIKKKNHKLKLIGTQSTYWRDLLGRTILTSCGVHGMALQLLIVVIGHGVILEVTSDPNHGRQTITK